MRSRLATYIAFGLVAAVALIVGIVAILALVGTGSSMIRRRVGGWRPSETLTQPRDDER